MECSPSLLNILHTIKKIMEMSQVLKYIKILDRILSVGPSAESRAPKLPFSEAAE